MSADRPGGAATPWPQTPARAGLCQGGGTALGTHRHPKPLGAALSGLSRAEAVAPEPPVNPGGFWGSNACPAMVVPRGCSQLGAVAKWGQGLVSFCLSPRGWLGLRPQGSVGTGRTAGQRWNWPGCPEPRRGGQGGTVPGVLRAEVAPPNRAPSSAPRADPRAGAKEDRWTGGGAASSCREHPAEVELLSRGTEALSRASRPAALCQACRGLPDDPPTRHRGPGKRGQGIGVG